MTTTPEPAVRPISYVVSCLPEGHDARWEFTVQIDYTGSGLFAVRYRNRDYSANGTWDLEPGWPETGIDEQQAWLAAHRFDHDTALRLAKELAPTLTYRGRTVADVLAAPQSAV